MAASFLIVLLWKNSPRNLLKFSQISLLRAKTSGVVTELFSQMTVQVAIISFSCCHWIQTPVLSAEMHVFFLKSSVVPWGRFLRGIAILHSIISPKATTLLMFNGIFQVQELFWESLNPGRVHVPGLVLRSYFTPLKMFMSVYLRFVLVQQS